MVTQLANVMNAPLNNRLSHVLNAVTTADTKPPVRNPHVLGVLRTVRKINFLLW